MNHYISGILKLALLEASVALLVIDRLLGDRFARGKKIAFAILAALACFAFINYGQLRGRGTMVHSWEQFHFYLGAKYQAEVGWFDLYKAVILADRESAHVLDGLSQTRDLTNFELVPVDRALEDAPRVRARFSPERWEEFKRDWRAIQQTPAPWFEALKDHGNSNSPAWALVAHPIAELLPLNPTSQILIGWIDFLLMGILFWQVFKTFEFRVACVALTIFSMAPIVFDYLAGSFLRWDWLFCLGMAMCMLERNRYATAGAFFGFAVATKLFPLFFGFALLIRAAYELLRTRRFDKRYLRFGVGSAAALVGAVLLSSAVLGGFHVWSEYKRRIDVTRDEKFYANQHSLRTVYLQVAASSLGEYLSEWAAPRAIKQGLPEVDLRDHRGGFLFVQLLFTLLVALTIARADDVAAFATGPLLVFTWLVVNMYYWNMLALLALGLAVRKERQSFGALLGLHAVWAAFYLYQHTNHGYAEGYFVATLITIGTVGFAAAEFVALYRRGLRPLGLGERARPTT